jgi:hypothetical protein
VCYCQGQVVHLAAWSEVEFVGEHEGFGDEDRIREGFEHIEGKEYK